MPDIAVHLETAQRNEVLAQKLADSGDFGWGITCLFYSALHLVEAYLVKSDRTTRTHRDRDLHIREIPELTPIHRRYVRLKQDSEHSRYEGWLFSDAAFRTLRDNVYGPVASHVRELVTA